MYVAVYLGANESRHRAAASAVWRELAARYVTALCALPDLAECVVKPPVPVPADSLLPLDRTRMGKSAKDRAGYLPGGRCAIGHIRGVP
jgi:hypothetical protein